MIEPQPGHSEPAERSADTTPGAGLPTRAIDGLPEEPGGDHSAPTDPPQTPAPISEHGGEVPDRFATDPPKVPDNDLCAITVVKEIQPQGNDTEAQRQWANGSHLGHYVLLEKIGEGGMGAVFRAEHTLIKRVVALKLLKPNRTDARSVQRFLLEAQANINLRHPGIVTTYDIGRDGDVLFMTMELIDGQDLFRYVARHGPMTPHQAADVITQAAEGLEHARLLDIVHRDIKPHNIMRRPNGQVQILDMGLARIRTSEKIEDLLARHPELHVDAVPDARLTAQGTIMGTMAYMAPEQASNPHDADTRSDIFSLGCTFYYLLTGVHAFRGKTTSEILTNRALGTVQPLREHNSSIPEELVAIVARMMARLPKDRYQTPGEVARDLHQWLRAAAERQAAANTQLPASNELDKLRTLLLELGLVTEADWHAAIDTASLPLIPLRALQLLQQHVSTRYQLAGLELPILTEYQSQQIMSHCSEVLRLGNYVVLERLARTGYGETLKTWNLSLSRLEVVRVFKGYTDATGNTTDPEKARIEAKLVAAHHHPHAAMIFQRGCASGESFLAMEFVQGRSLRDLVQEHSSLPLGHALAYAAQILAVLRHAHEVGVSQCDLKPEKIFVTATGTIKLLDLGLHQAMWPTGAGDDSAHDAVRPPERWRSVPPSGPLAEIASELTACNLAIRGDIYSFGCTLYFLLRGQMPFVAVDRDHLELAHLKQPPPSLSAYRGDLPRKFDQVMQKILAKEPQQRYTSAQEVWEALRPFAFAPRNSISPLLLVVVLLQVVALLLILLGLWRTAAAS